MLHQALLYKRITHWHIPEVAPLLQLYEKAFPVQERRRSEQLLQLFQQPDMHLYTANTVDRLAGFYIYWRLDGFCFLEHIAVSPALRGQGIGRQFMQRLLQSGEKLVLEIERPTDETSRRRIRFYQSLGFTLHTELDYHQPPYHIGQQPVPLYLMAVPPLTDLAEAVRIADVIKQQVYERFYE